MRAMRILVTAGPTREPLDPLRFISNYSTGAMGYAIARAARSRRHRVVLVTGPTHLIPPKKIKVISVTTCQEMFGAVRAQIKDIDCVIMAAAVSDFRPAAYSSQKIKRNGPLPNLALRKNVDILDWLKQHREGRILVGFCLETEGLIANAREKLLTKRLDMVVANRIDRNLSVFGPGRTKVVVIGPGKEQETLSGATKDRVAAVLLDKIEQLRYKKTQDCRRSSLPAPQGCGSSWLRITPLGAWYPSG